ncbi:MAG: hypothetical protein WC980_07145 [Candidatus Brocadiia bacterium]
MITPSFNTDNLAHYGKIVNVFIVMRGAWNNSIDTAGMPGIIRL